MLPGTIRSLSRPITSDRFEEAPPGPLPENDTRMCASNGVMVDRYDIKIILQKVDNWCATSVSHFKIVSTNIQGLLHDALFRIGSSAPMLALRSESPVSALAP